MYSQGHRGHGGGGRYFQRYSANNRPQRYQANNNPPAFFNGNNQQRMGVGGGGYYGYNHFYHPNQMFSMNNFNTRQQFLPPFPPPNRYSNSHWARGSEWQQSSSYLENEQLDEDGEPLQTYYYTSGILSSVEKGGDQNAPETGNKSRKTQQKSSSNPPATFQSHKMTVAQKQQQQQQKQLATNLGDDNLSSANMAEKLTQQLRNESYECMVCCEAINVTNFIWSCSNCYHVFHLNCIQEWSQTVLNNPIDAFPIPDQQISSTNNASTSTGNGTDVGTNSNAGRRNLMIADLYMHIYAYAQSSDSNSSDRGGASNFKKSNEGWRCPGCQFIVTTGTPRTYKCFCGKLTHPEYTPGETPHTCGEMCGRRGRGKGCEHPCTLLCHPGPCPPCVAMVTKLCDCGKESKSLRCDKSDVVKCLAVCDEDLNCKKHKCEEVCHKGDCKDCDQTVEVECYCGKEKTSKKCTEIVSSHSCKQSCLKPLDCGNHFCELECHPGSCNPCEASLSAIKTCPCGKKPIEEGKRTSCLDKIPTCENACTKKLKCGPKNKNHRCESKCHLGPCPVCPLETNKRCRCGSNTITVKCSQLLNDGEVLCTRVCKRKLHCNKHQCRKLCCIDVDGHVCTATCNRLLSCGVHQCLENCHRGNCERCWESSFEDLTCHCGRSRISAPVPCGTPAPHCDFPCMREHPCGHPPQHNCHSDEKCPPCPVLVQAPCLGGHVVMNSVPCYIQQLSCGRPCSKGLPNCNHLCVLTCHSGACLPNGQKCQQKCQERRFSCGHACNEVCHYGDGDCPDTLCKQLVPITCPCGRVKEQIPCHDYSQLRQTQNPNSSIPDLSDLTLSASQSANAAAKNCAYLSCRDTCKRDAWLQRLDCAFGPIEKNPNVQFTDYLMQSGTTGGYAEFVCELEKIFFNLVQQCVDTSFKQQHSFKPMNATRRRIIHELAPFYGLDTLSYDEEPHKHIVVTGYRNNVKIPPVSLTSLISKRVQSQQQQQKQQQPIPQQYQMAQSANNAISRLFGKNVPGNQSQFAQFNENAVDIDRNILASQQQQRVNNKMPTSNAWNVGNNYQQQQQPRQQFQPGVIGGGVLGSHTNWASNAAAAASLPFQQQQPNPTSAPFDERPPHQLQDYTSINMNNYGQQSSFSNTGPTSSENVIDSNNSTYNYASVNNTASLSGGSSVFQDQWINENAQQLNSSSFSLRPSHQINSQSHFINQNPNPSWPPSNMTEFNMPPIDFTNPFQQSSVDQSGLISLGQVRTRAHPRSGQQRSQQMMFTNEE